MQMASNQGADEPQRSSCTVICNAMSQQGVPHLPACLQGAVYTAYGIFVITLIPALKNDRLAAKDNQGGFPDTWASSDIGKFG